MGTPNALKALDPVELRFTEPEDVARYGDRWYRWEEGRYLRMRARDLITIEGMLGMSLVSVMNGMRANTTLGDTAAAWLAVREVDPVLAGEFDDFNPVTNLIEWRDAAEGKDGAATDQDKALEPPATPPPADADSPMDGPWPNTISDQPPSVVSLNLPDAV